MNDLLVHVANFVGRGELPEPAAGGRGPLTFLPLHLGRRCVELRQDPKLVLVGHPDLRGQFAKTTTARIRDVAVHEIPHLVALVRDTCWLLSLASMSRVVPYAYDFPPGRIVSAWSVPGVCGRSWQLIDCRNGGAVRRFVESTFQTFRRLKRKRRIPEIIDTLLSTETGTHPVEASMILAHVSLEMCVDVWARDTGVTYQRGFFYRHVKATARPARYAYGDMLKDMCGSVGIRRSVSRVVANRNVLIHSGGLRLSRRAKRSAYVETQRLAREYLLRMLGYRGYFVRFGARKYGLIR